MNEINKIQQLSEKYWVGETSLEEEKVLQEYFSKSTDQSSPEKAYFSYLDIERSRTYEGKVMQPKRWTSKIVRMILPIAASLVLLAGALWTINQKSPASNEVVIDDPQLALQVTREAFALLNGKVDDGEQTLKDNIIHLDKTFIFKNL